MKEVVVGLSKHQQLLCGGFDIGVSHPELLDYLFVETVQDLSEPSDGMKVCLVATDRLSDEVLTEIILALGGRAELRVVTTGRLGTRGRDVLRDSNYHIVLTPTENPLLFESGSVHGSMTVAEAISAGARSVQQLNREQEH